MAKPSGPHQSNSCGLPELRHGHDFAHSFSLHGKILRRLLNLAKAEVNEGLKILRLFSYCYSRTRMNGLTKELPQISRRHIFKLDTTRNLHPHPR